ncbi:MULTISPECIES: sporulation protein YqfD [unclassified Sedimentibacter]|uniref:sporulation protein YqfD n=1 Tax=unclassified Sedimentibacter TaxID=2649220 RepID=UPI0027DFF579|nr:sporulation protein YqfD [Sedimentibacter sp. MB35-C1]WMJ76265.1 sporulation protein YqfD [Sedimentibacter sp. MB35-C1]
MLIFKLMYLLRGYVVVRLKASNCEKIINLLRRKGIRMWDVEKNEESVRFKISYEDYRKYEEILRETKTEAVSKKGFALKLRKLRVRKGFIVGLFILFICLYIISSLVWSVQIVGTTNLTAKEIMRTLDENSIKIPIAHTEIKAKKIETLLYSKFENFKFVEVYIEGSNLIIFVKEKTPEKAEIKTNEPSSIISVKNAIINKVIAKSGQPVVKEGDVVYEGQTLVMGMVKNKNSDEFMMVPSEGTIYGKTYYNFEMKEEKLREIETATNKSKNVYYLQINGNGIKIIGDKDPYENYNYREKIINIPIISNLSDIALVKGTYYEQELKPFEIDEATAKNTMTVNMYDDLLKKCGADAKILKSSINFLEDEKYYYLRAQIEIIEDIGEKVRLYPMMPADNEDGTT